MSTPASDPARAPEIIIGIDLGTTNSLVAFADARGPRILTDESGEAGLPSVVRLEPDGSTVVGAEARAHAIEFPDRTVYSVKRLMGRSRADLADDLALLPFEVVDGEHDTARIAVGDRVYAAQEISAFILASLKSRAEAALETPVRKAVITVPAYFDDAQRQATRDAGRMAGLDVVRIVNEPTAAALAYGIGQAEASATETIAVYDLGGGTFDVSILRVTPATDEDASAFFQVVSTAGDTHLGGDDVDRLIIELVFEEIRAEYGAELTFPPSTRQALRQFAEAVKIRLSSESSADLRIDLGANRSFERTLTRDQLEAMIAPWADRTTEACRRALRDAKLAATDIDRVVLVGGSTRIPLIRRLVAETFGSEPYTALDPDQVVALGAAVQASILAGTNQGALLLDVIPLSLGIETTGGAVAKLIMRNTTVPTQATEMFSTSVDGQTNVKIHVVQGERELVKDCRSLGEFDLRDVPPMPAGIPQIEVAFLVDANGVLDVSAVERRSGKRASIQVVPRHGLTREEVDAMEDASLAHAKEDMHAHRVIDLAVNARLDVKWIRDALTRVEHELDDDYRRELVEKIERVERFIEESRTAPEMIDADAFHETKEALAHFSVRMHEIAITESLRRETDSA